MELEKDLEIDFLFEFIKDETRGYVKNIVYGKAGFSFLKYYYITSIVYVKTRDKKNDRFFAGTCPDDLFTQIKYYYNELDEHFRK